MGVVNKKEIIATMEEMKNGERLGFRLSSSFGSGVVFIELNPAYPGKGQKKSLMKWGKSEADTKAKIPLITADKAKIIAGWVADRFPELLTPAV
jgi:hypothetical protein